MLAFDTETTGPDPETARIVQACATLVRPDGEPVVTEWLVDPGVDIPAEATAVHGITTEMVRSQGLAPHLAVRDIHATLTGVWELGFPVVIMNAPYDLTVLDRELLRHCGHGIGEVGHVVDPMVIDKTLDKWRRGKRTLTDLAAHYRVKLEEAHSAAGDGIAAARVAWRLAQVYPQVRNAGLAELDAMQASWRAAWAADFQHYLRTKAPERQPDAVIDGSWPIRRAQVPA